MNIKTADLLELSLCEGGALCGPLDRTTFAFVPPEPKELTTAMTAPDLLLLSKDTTEDGNTAVLCPVSASGTSINGLSLDKCKFGGTWRECTHITALMSPARPAAPSRWPIFVFTAPTTSGNVLPDSCFSVWDRSTLRMAPHSIGSPRGVPVPCDSMYETSWGRTLAFSRLCRRRLL